MSGLNHRPAKTEGLRVPLVRMEEPIDVAETEACWRWAIELGDETVPVEKFEEEFKFSLQDLTNWWNKKVLDLSI